MYTAVSHADTQNAPTLILIHGAGSSHLGWHSLIRRMPGMNVHALDLPGHGRSEGKGLDSVQAYVDVIATYIASVPSDRVYIVGHSLGGMIGLQLALTIPRKLAGLCMISSSARHPIPLEIATRIQSAEHFEESFDWLIDHLGNPQLDAKWVEQTRKAVGNIPRDVLIGDLMAGQGVDLTEQAAELQIPVLVISAGQDRFFAPEEGRRLAAIIPQGEFISVPDAGHLLPLEKPDLVEKMIREFVFRTSRITDR